LVPEIIDWRNVALYFLNIGRKEYEKDFARVSRIADDAIGLG